MLAHTMSRVARVPLHLIVLGSILFLLAITASAQSSQTGTVQGRVLNELSGRYLNNARISIEGTNLEAVTNADGFYALTRVPVGEVVVSAHFDGLDTQAETVAIVSDSPTVQDFGLSITTMQDGEVVKLEPMSVEAVTMSGQAVALNEQRNAANIKNVISLDEFVDMADGNLGEFLKFIPGVDVAYNPFYPTNAGIRGMPASGTVIQYDGVSLAAPAVAGNRTFDLNTAASGNVERLEVSKVPTPDMPANAVGGSINVISKSGFSRKSSLFTYNLYTTYSARKGEFDPSFKDVAGADSLSTKPSARLAYQFSYLLPIKNKYAISIDVTHAPRVQEGEFLSPAWNLTPGKEVVANQYMSEYLTMQTTDTAKFGFDWKIGDYSTIKANYFKTDRVGLRRYDRVRWVVNSAGRVGDENMTSGRGDVRQANNWQTQHRELDGMSLIYRYDGPIWKMDTSFSYSKGKYYSPDMSDGSFGVLDARSASNGIDYVINGHQAIQQNPGRIPDVTATSVATGAPIDIFDGNNLAINSVTSNDSLSYLNEVKSGGVNVAREFDLAVPTTIKIGLLLEESSRGGHTANRKFNFRPNGSSSYADRLASNFDLLEPSAYSDRQYFTTASGKKEHTKFISMAKLYDLYKQNPDWFVLDERGAYIAQVNGSQKVTETITAAYVRMDNKLLNNRLKFTSGVRFERTEDEGSGPLNDIAATYEKNPDGTFKKTPGGDFILVPGSSLDRAKLQYTERGASKSTSYDGFYPSVNASFELNQKMIIRAGYAGTIGRPDLKYIIPSTTVSDPDDINVGADVLGSIRLVDGELQPWSANNYDLTFEAYDVKGATFSVSGFQKDVKNFFTTSREMASAELLAEVGLTPDLVGSYQVVRTTNSGTARIRGLELSYRQDLSALADWGKRVQFFGNFTSQNITGPNAGDFARVADKMLRGGISYVHPKFVVKLNVSYEDYLKLGTASGGRYTYLSPSTRWDFSTKYRFNKWLSVYFSVRNLTAEPQKRSVLDFNYDQPKYTEPRDWRYLPATYSLGIKGSF